MGRKRINYALLNSEDPTSTADGKQPAPAGEVGKLPWTEDMDICLLKLVMHHSAYLHHLGTEKKTAAKNGAPAIHAKPSDR